MMMMMVIITTIIKFIISALHQLPDGQLQIHHKNKYKRTRIISQYDNNQLKKILHHHIEQKLIHKANIEVHMSEAF
jgi:phosphopantothenate synthetase